MNSFEWITKKWMAKVIFVLRRPGSSKSSTSFVSSTILGQKWAWRPASTEVYLRLGTPPKVWSLIHCHLVINFHNKIRLNPSSVKERGYMIQFSDCYRGKLYHETQLNQFWFWGAFRQAWLSLLSTSMRKLILPMKLSQYLSPLIITPQIKPP